MVEPSNDLLKVGAEAIQKTVQNLRARGLQILHGPCLVEGGPDGDDELVPVLYDQLRQGLTNLGGLAAQASPLTFAALADQMKALAGSLSEMGNIPMIAAEMPLILDLASDPWWEGATLPMLEQVRLKLRGLVKLIEKVQRAILYTDFEDELGVPRMIDIGGFTVGTDPEKFKAKVRQFLLEHETHFAIQRLRTNQPLTAMDLAELERMLAGAGLGAPDQLAKAKAECHGLGLFIRSLVGLQRDAAKAAFNGFVSGRTLNACQLEFIDLMIDHLTQRGVMDPGLLYESPFTDQHSLGIEGVFQPAEVQELVRILEDVQDHAVA